MMQDVRSTGHGHARIVNYTKDDIPFWCDIIIHPIMSIDLYGTERATHYVSQVLYLGKYKDENDVIVEVIPEMAHDSRPSKRRRSEMYTENKNDPDRIIHEVKPSVTFNCMNPSNLWHCNTETSLSSSGSKTNDNQSSEQSRELCTESSTGDLELCNSKSKMVDQGDISSLESGSGNDWQSKIDIAAQVSRWQKVLLGSLPLSLDYISKDQCSPYNDKG